VSEILLLRCSYQCLRKTKLQPRSNRCIFCSTELSDTSTRNLYCCCTPSGDDNVDQSSTIVSLFNIRSSSASSTNTIARHINYTFRIRKQIGGFGLMLCLSDGNFCSLVDFLPWTNDYQRIALMESRVHPFFDSSETCREKAAIIIHYWQFLFKVIINKKCEQIAISKSHC